MEQLACSSLKDSMIDYLRSMTDVVNVAEDCVVTLPIITFDDRWVSVSVSESVPGFFMVTDDGKSCDELFLQGISLTPNVLARLGDVGAKFGVTFDRGKFSVGCKRDFLQHSIWAIGQCSALAMNELIGHRRSAEDDSRKRVGSIISEWGSGAGFSVKANVPVFGRTAEHSFDYVARNINLSIAVNLLAPSSNGKGRAERYGYQALDLEATVTGSWPKVAILSRPDQWSEEARTLVGKFAVKVIDYYDPQNAKGPIFESLDSIRRTA